MKQIIIKHNRHEQLGLSKIMFIDGIKYVVIQTVFNGIEEELKLVEFKEFEYLHILKDTN